MFGIKHIRQELDNVINHIQVKRSGSFFNRNLSMQEVFDYAVEVHQSVRDLDNRVDRLVDYLGLEEKHVMEHTIITKKEKTK